MDAYRELLQKTLFECDRCGEKLSLESFDTAVALYGIIFLFGKDNGYFGTLCPKCEQTTLQKRDGAFIEPLRERLLHGDLLARMYIEPRFRYHSFPYNLDYHEERMPSFIINYPKPLNANSGTLEEWEVDHLFVDDSIELSEGYCSYFFGDQAIGPTMDVWWFREEEIADLVNIENETGLKIFPRYILYNDFYPAIDTFCWEYYLSQDLIEKLDVPTGTEVKEKGLSPPQKEIKRDSAFSNILIAEQSYLDNTSGDFNQTKQLVLKTSTNHDEMIAEVKSGFGKGYGQDFFDKNYLGFIKDYIKIAQRIDFSFAAVWELKMDYLDRLYKHMRREVLSNVQYAFFEEPPTWTIIFDGKPIRSLQGEGFTYMHYLVSHMRKEISVHDLNAITGIPTEPLPSSEKNYGYDSRHDDYSEGVISNGDPGLSGQAKGDVQFLNELYQYKKEFSAELEKAQDDNDLAEQQRIGVEIEKIEAGISALLRSDGQKQKFKDDTDKLRDKIGIGIKRAVRQLMTSNEKAGTHFKDAIRPYSNPLSYYPREDIKWHFQ